MSSVFDITAPSRADREAAKWDSIGPDKYVPDVVPLSVADMEFLSPPQIIAALEETARFGMYGYTMWGDRYFNALHKWMKERHDWEIDRNSIVRTSGVVPALGVAVRTFTKPGDSVVIQTPVYHPFYSCVEDNGRNLIYNPLIRTDHGYEMDFEDLEAKLSRPEVTAIVLCSPHNPVGRVWREDELRRVGDLCLKYNVFVICDEIHNDLICPGHKHTVYATLGKEYADNCIIGTAPSKTFSLAGLCLSNIIIPDPEKKAQFHKEVMKSGASTVSIFGTVATEVGYEECAPWVDEVMDYVKGNHDYLTAFFADHFPQCWVCPLEGTYLAWVDFAAMEPDQEKRTKFLQEKAKLYLSNGTQFGAPTFERFNLACSREVLVNSLDRLLAAAREAGLA